ncbi:MAG TPA: hypothetical protein PLX28_00295 [Candidatus Woesebacteria bacterium]|jgi:hypothetical protein|nr:hypothetical protein [Candidatus Woesebacteria bacterium]HOA11958.1 hypothetical protein [Candidatus Woesebacteria bacterium]HOC07858.1 hypothetical protein [Candidatus Woesebacteria bacterium]HOI04883.1 hypothetical protein [Candidatus Woesebacteria bacterium]HOP38762.1 hypothetical protein [Candidatus Woesebacteria bacterium]
MIKEIIPEATEETVSTVRETRVAEAKHLLSVGGQVYRFLEMKC